MNECQIVSTICGTDQKCENIYGSYNCRCSTGQLAVAGQCILTTTSIASTEVNLNEDNTGLVLAIVLPIVVVSILIAFAFLVCYFYFKM